MYCPSCGSLNDGALLCMTCGRELSEPARPPPREPVAEAAAEPPAPVIAPELVVPAPPVAAPEQPCPTHPDLPVGGTCSRCGKFVCIRCAPRLAEGSSLCTDCLAREATVSDSEGIGGWLILPAITIVLTPLASAALAVTALVTGNLVSLMMGALLTGFGAVAAFNFFARKRQAPLFMIGFYALSIVGNVLMHQAWVSAGWGVVWIIYFLTSDRVKRTFVK